jgi:hypothetical protein
MIGPEAQLQYHWRAGRFRPYAGGGVGFAYVKSDFIGSDTDLTLSAACGLISTRARRFLARCASAASSAISPAALPNGSADSRGGSVNETVAWAPLNIVQASSTKDDE